MNDILWVPIGLIGAIIIFAGLLRLRNPHSRKMAHEQDQLDKKTKTKTGEAPASASSGSSAGKLDPFELLRSNPAIVLMIAVVAFLSWYFFPSGWESPSLAKVMEWKNAYWLPIFVASAVFYALAAYTGKAAETVRGFLIAVLAMLFVGFPAWVWIFTPAAPQEEAMLLQIPGGGKSKYVPVPRGMRVVMSGEDFRFHCVYADGHEESFAEGERSCSSGNMPFVYATNLRTGQANMVSYSFKK